jgi:hypothetical protein
VNWSLRKADVGLRVTKFAPQTEKPVAGLSPYIRALWRDKREKECRKVAPALELNSR